MANTTQNVRFLDYAWPQLGLRRDSGCAGARKVDTLMRQNQALAMSSSSILAICNALWLGPAASRILFDDDDQPNL